MSLRLRELTPRGAGGVSVLSLSGEGALAFLPKLGVEGARVGELRVARLSVEGESLDEAMICVLAADQVELHVHGSPPLVAQLSRLLTGGVSASLGLEALAIEQMKDAPCEQAARVLLDQAEGALRGEFEGYAALDPSEFAQALRERLDQSQALRRLFEPARVLLAGPVNAGKSTLFNLLVGGERVITSAEAGTTRDLVEELVLVSDWPIRLRDSAGLRELDAGEAGVQVELAGQGLARRAFASADLILWLLPPGGEGPPAELEDRVLVLPSRGDLEADGGNALRGLRVVEAPAETLERIGALLQHHFDWPREPWAAGRPVIFDAQLALELESSLAEGEQAARERIVAWLAR